MVDGTPAWTEELRHGFALAGELPEDEPGTMHVLYDGVEVGRIAGDGKRRRHRGGNPKRTPKAVKEALRNDPGLGKALDEIILHATASGQTTRIRAGTARGRNGSGSRGPAEETKR